MTHPSDSERLTSAHTSPSSTADVDRLLSELRRGSQRLAQASLAERIERVEECIRCTSRVAPTWVELGCEAKRTGHLAAGRAEEILAGPVATLRFLHLTAQTFRDLQAKSWPQLPGAPVCHDGQWRVPVFPTRQLFDCLLFRGLSAETWLEPGVEPDQWFGNRPAQLLRACPITPQVELVLGAGNVSSIALTDSLTKILHEDCAVLLKMNPVNAYLQHAFEEALQPMIDAGWLRIVSGGREIGSYAALHANVDRVHLTGSTETHDLVVWGDSALERQRRKEANQPFLDKPVSSELGNVTPWIVVPGDYSRRQLRAQAEGIVASIVNNASFNCIATKMLITWSDWTQQEPFLNLVEEILRATPTRYAYYPGAFERFREFSGESRGETQDGHLPWQLIRGRNPLDHRLMFDRESFVCVVGQTSLKAATPEEFLDRAVQMANEQMTGTLAANLTVPAAWQRKHATLLDQAVRKLRYGTIGINQWAGVAFALMSPPWGGFSGATLHDVQSGIGTVHNTFLLARPQKTILRGPLSLMPKPVWFSSHACPDEVASRLCAFYQRPAWWRLPSLLVAALRG